MSEAPTSIPRISTLEPAEDFYRLRRDGIGFIEKMASRLWTDYNTHDPGITILETLCYAITDLAYRIRWDIADILTPEDAPADPAQPYPNQAFFTARHILTINPLTPDDFRRLLIDLDQVRGAWIFCKECACELGYLAWCDAEKQLQLSYVAPDNVSPAPKRVSPLGLYEALLALESDPTVGDLNDRKIERTVIFNDQTGAHSILMELRFPDFSLSNAEQWADFLGNDDAFANRNGESFAVSLTRIGATRDFNALDDTSLKTEADRDAYIRKHWRDVLYASFEITLNPSGKKITIENAALRVYSDNATQNAATVALLKAALEEKGTGGFISLYHKKAESTRAAVKSAKEALRAHRNLDEDYCTIGTIGIDEVAVCADVEVRPDADIEYVQARIWLEIENYFDPPLRFYSLQELMDESVAVEDIFDGPELDSGFIRQADLDAASLKTVLRTSDIINRIMGIDGVISVNQLMLTKYDSDGNVVSGAADPTWGADGTPVFDGNKTAAFWLLYLGSRQLPRLYRNASRFLFYRDGLPFLPRLDEVNDTLDQLRGQQERPKVGNGTNDLPIPQGMFRKPEDYFPVQYSFPPVYGVGPSGLAADADDLRRAQAKQLKAYLMVFEQLLGDALAQLAHTADLFSLDREVIRTYFVKAFDKTTIAGLDDIGKNLDKPHVESITESQAEFFARRNMFLDHLLARFGEQFGEYALLLANWDSGRVAEEKLVDDKIAFLEAYPVISHDRGKAFDYSRAAPFDYSKPVGSQANESGIKRRIRLLLGEPDLAFEWNAVDSGGGKYQAGFKLKASSGTVWLEGGLSVTGGDAVEGTETAYRILLEKMIQFDSYEIVPESARYRLKITDASVEYGQSPELFDTSAGAAALRDQLLTWSANERLLVVEHLLLRPKFIGDALYPACVDGGGGLCGDEDPYSFRLTFVMPGWTVTYTDNLDMRHFAERTIQRETPSHLLGKICWVGNDGLVENPCDEVVSKLADLLVSKGKTTSGERPSDADACACAETIQHAFSAIFQAWYAGKELDFIRVEALDKQVSDLFADEPQPSKINCGPVDFGSLWGDVVALMVAYFQQVARNGYQFERFEHAWRQWQEANAKFDWTEERLQERVEAILRGGALTASVDGDALCRCAAGILTAYGMHFFDWMNGNLANGSAFKDFTPFEPLAVTLCKDMKFRDGTDDAIQHFLDMRYGAYAEVSFRLHVVVILLSELRNTYPGATLHDCEEGGDLNPVRLGSTALGSYPSKATAT